MIDDITGVILAGGKSRRMGLDKAFLKINNRPIIEEVFRRLKDVFAEVVIISDKIKKFYLLDARVIPDIIPSCGPLGGIYTGLIKSGGFYIFVAACDMPFLCQDLIKYMLGQADGCDVVVARHKGRVEPLCGIYSKNCIKPAQEQLKRGNLKIRDLFPRVKTRIITEGEIAGIDSGGRSFVNINTKEDYCSVT